MLTYFLSALEDNTSPRTQENWLNLRDKVEILTFLSSKYCLVYILYNGELNFRRNTKNSHTFATYKLHATITFRTLKHEDSASYVGNLVSLQEASRAFTSIHFRIAIFFASKRGEARFCWSARDLSREGRSWRAPPSLYFSPKLETVRYIKEGESFTNLRLKRDTIRNV